MNKTSTIRISEEAASSLKTLARREGITIKTLVENWVKNEGVGEKKDGDKAVTKEVDRLVKMLRAFEKTYFTNFDDRLIEQKNLLRFLVDNSVRNTFASELQADDPHTFQEASTSDNDDERIRSLIRENEKTEKVNQNLKEEFRNLLNKMTIGSRQNRILQLSESEYQNYLDYLK